MVSKTCSYRHRVCRGTGSVPPRWRPTPRARAPAGVVARHRTPVLAHHGRQGADPAHARIGVRLQRALGREDCSPRNRWALASFDSAHGRRDEGVVAALVDLGHAPHHAEGLLVVAAVVRAGYRRWCAARSASGNAPRSGRYAGCPARCPRSRPRRGRAAARRSGRVLKTVRCARDWPRRTKRRCRVAHRIVQAVDDHLLVGDDLIDVGVEIGNPVQRLLRRRDVVAQEANTTIGERTLRRSITDLPSGLRSSPEVSRLPTNRFCTIQSISSRLSW